MSDQCLGGKGNKSLSPSSSSHRKHMDGESWWRDWIEPLFSGASSQPQAAWGTLRNATGTFKGEGGKKTVFPRVEVSPALSSLWWRWKFIWLSIITFILPRPPSHEEPKQGIWSGMKVILMLENLFSLYYSWKHSNSVVHLSLCLQICLISTQPFWQWNAWE